MMILKFWSINQAYYKFYVCNFNNSLQIYIQIEFIVILTFCLIHYSYTVDQILSH